MIINCYLIQWLTPFSSLLPTIAIGIIYKQGTNDENIVNKAESSSCPSTFPYIYNKDRNCRADTNATKNVIIKIIITLT